MLIPRVFISYTVTYDRTRIDTQRFEGREGRRKARGGRRSLIPVLAGIRVGG
jgi:hypothetical protein